jgi:hypothetical protein
MSANTNALVMDSARLGHRDIPQVRRRAAVAARRRTANNSHVRMLTRAARDPTPGPRVQSADQLWADPERFRPANRLMSAILDRVERV